jgi:hypothetical protein
MDTHIYWAGKRGETREPVRGHEATRRLDRRARPLRFTFHVSRFTHHAIVTAKVHRFYTVPTPFCDSLFAILFPLKHLQKPIHQIVTIRCNSGLTLPPPFLAAKTAAPPGTVTGR